MFISYSRADGRLVDALVAGLEARGHDPWIDVEDIASGSWAASIVDAIRKSDLAVVVLTETSVRSRNVLQEVRLAAKNHVPLIPAVVYPPPEVPDSIEYHIVGEQRVDIDRANVQAAVGSLIRAVEASDTHSERQTRQRARGCLASLAVLGVVAFGVATVITGRIPPWAPVPACGGVTATIEDADPAEFVTLKGAVLTVVVRNESDRQVNLPGSSEVRAVGRDGFEYRHENGLTQGPWFLPESVGPGSTKALKLGIATEPSRESRDRVRLHISGVSDMPIPILRCEIVTPGAGVRFAR